MKTPKILRKFLCWSGLLLVVGLASATAVWAGGAWRVIPIRLDLDARSKSGVVTLINDGDTAVNLQMQAMLWSQDGQGKDVYEETGDLIFFPRIMTLPAKQERVLRTGIKIPGAALEKTYRLFIQEMPEPKPGQGATVSISIRFGLPVFVAPPQPEMQGEVTGLSLSQGTLGFQLHNNGNVHFRVQNLKVTGKDAQGNEVFTQELEAWYLLAHASRPYTITLPQESCEQAQTWEVAAVTDQGDFAATLPSTSGLCRP